MLNQKQHRQLLFFLLKDFFQSDFGKSLAFKGGTACYFLHWLDRFSTDLDFDLLEDVNDIDQKILTILKKYGQVKKGNKFILSYGEKETNIKIDLNRKIWQNNHYQIIDFYGITIKVQDKATIFSNKLVAFLERNTNRDLYDIYFFYQKMFPVNQQLILERTGANYSKLLKKILIKLKKFSQHYNILDWLGEVLDNKQKYFVKNKLVSELVAVIEFELNWIVRGK